jgi:hypothetical protein
MKKDNLTGSAQDFPVLPPQKAIYSVLLRNYVGRRPSYHITHNLGVTLYLSVVSMYLSCDAGSPSLKYIYNLFLEFPLSFFLSGLD